MAEAIVGRAAELRNVLELLEDDAHAMRALVIEGEAGSRLPDPDRAPVAEDAVPVLGLCSSAGRGYD